MSGAPAPAGPGRAGLPGRQRGWVGARGWARRGGRRTRGRSERGAGRADAGALPGRLGAADGFIGPFGSDAPSADSLSDPNTRWPPAPDPAEPPNISRLKSPARHTVGCAAAGAAPRHPLAPRRRRGRAGVTQHRVPRQRRSPRSRGRTDGLTDRPTAGGGGEAAPSSPLAGRRCRHRRECPAEAAVRGAGCGTSAQPGPGAGGGGAGLTRRRPRQSRCKQCRLSALRRVFMTHAVVRRYEILMSPVLRN